MDAYHKLLTGVSIGLLLVGAYIGYEWLQAHDAQVRAEAQVKADQQAIEKISEQQKGLADQLAQVRKDQSDQLAAVGKTFQQTQTPQQLAALIAQLTGLKQAPIVVTPAPTPQNPNPQPTIELPDAPQVKAYFQACETCKIDLAAAQKDLTIAKSQGDLDQQKLELVTSERDSWKTAATGGSWARRAGKRALDFLVDAAITTAVVCGSGHCK